MTTITQQDREVARSRRETIEECAKVADQWATEGQIKHGNGGPGAAIRALAGKDGGSDLDAACGILPKD